MLKLYYVYTYTDIVTKNIVYVGKGKSSNKRHLNHLNGRCSNRILNSKIKQGNQYSIDIIKDQITEAEAFELEISLIRKYGRVCDNTGTLYNLTFGGEGCSGYVYSIEEIVRRYKNRVIVTLQNTETNEIKTWQSTGIAARELCTSSQVVWGVTRGKIKAIYTPHGTWKLPSTDLSQKYIDRKKSIQIKDLTDDKIYSFMSMTDAAKFINVSKAAVLLLNQKKILHINRKFTLPGTTLQDVNNLPRVGTQAKVRLKSRKPITIYDSLTKSLLKFNSHKECSKYTGSGVSDISSLSKGQIKTIKCGRYRLESTVAPCL